MRFVDTNILIYSLDLKPTHSEKCAIATALLKSTDLVLSVQVLQEFYVQATNVRRADALPHEIACRFIQKWMRFKIQDNTAAVLQLALQTKERFQTSYWDAAILAAAKISRCRELLTEDLNHGQNYDGITVINPFVAG